MSHFMQYDISDGVLLVISGQSLNVLAESVKGRDVTQPVAFWILNWWRTKRLGVMRVHKQTGVLSFIWLKSDRPLVR